MQLLFGGFAAFIFFLSIEDQSFNRSAIVAIFVYLGMWVGQLLFNAFYLSFGKKRSLLTTHIVEVQDNAFYEETQFGRSYHFWPGIVKVISLPGFVAVYVDANAAHVLPGRAFSSPEHRKEFLSALKDRLGTA